MATVARTVVCPLETSQRKRERLRGYIDQQQEIFSFLSDIAVGLPQHKFDTNDSQTRWLIDENFEYDIYAHDAYHATREKVFGAYNSYFSNGSEGERPKFGDGDYYCTCSCGSCDKRAEIVENDRGYGVKLKLESYSDPLWFHARSGGYQEEYFDRLISGELSYGRSEIHCRDGDVYLYLFVTEEVELPDAEDIERYIGVDIGERVLYAMASVDCEGCVEAVEQEGGSEFRHHREKLQRKRDRLQEKGHLQKMLSVGNQRERYTEQELDTASKHIVDFASERFPCCIRLEDMTGYRVEAEEPIHDFPFAMLQTKIEYKAKERSIPVEYVDPAYTSLTCRECGNTHEHQRNGDSFKCFECGYDNHSDVNAAMNIAQDING